MDVPFGHHVEKKAKLPSAILRRIRRPRVHSPARSSLYSLAAVAFVGGSIAAGGGHNPLEPAQFGVPIVMGPHTHNFRAMVQELLAHDAMRVAGKDELAATLAELLRDRGAAVAMGHRAREVFEAQAGATARSVEALRVLLEGGA